MTGADLKSHREARNDLIQELRVSAQVSCLSARHGLIAILLFAALPIGCRRPEANPATAPAIDAAAAAAAAAASMARARAASARVPFVHALLSQAESHVAHEDCSPGALRAVAEQVRDIQRKGASSTTAASHMGSDATGCPSAVAEELRPQVKGPLLDRAGACVGRDGPLDAEWDMLNSAVLSLGLCLDCSRAAKERGADCKRSRAVIDRVEKSARKAASTPAAAPK
jgi:hypothetical protein